MLFLSLSIADFPGRNRSHSDNYRALRPTNILLKFCLPQGCLRPILRRPRGYISYNNNYYYIIINIFYISMYNGQWVLSVVVRLTRYHRRPGGQRGHSQEKGTNRQINKSEGFRLPSKGKTNSQVLEFRSDRLWEGLLCDLHCITYYILF